MKLLVTITIISFFITWMVFLCYGLELKCCDRIVEFLNQHYGLNVSTMLDLVLILMFVSIFCLMFTIIVSIWVL